MQNKLNESSTGGASRFCRCYGARLLLPVNGTQGREAREVRLRATQESVHSRSVNQGYVGRGKSSNEWRRGKTRGQEGYGSERRGKKRRRKRKNICKKRKKLRQRNVEGQVIERLACQLTARLLAMVNYLFIRNFNDLQNKLKLPLCIKIKFCVLKTDNPMTCAASSVVTARTDDITQFPPVAMK